MANSGLLQAKGIVDIIAGGYPGEPKGAEAGYSNWTDVNDASDGVVSTYFYCDSNASNNATRSQTNVKVLTKWSATLDDQNVFEIHTDTYLVGIERIARPGAMEGCIPASSGDTPSLGRDIYVFSPDAPCSAGAALQHWFVPYNYNGVVFSGNLYISSATYRIAPGKTSGYQSGITYRNLVQGRPGYLCIDSRYTDAMVIGFQFRNNLPTDLPPPTHMSTDQVPDICENYMDVYLTFDAPPVNGAELYLEWRYPGEEWSEEKSVVEVASRDNPVTAVISHVAPTNHTDSPITIEWRAKFRPRSVQMEESDWTYGSTQIEYIPAPNMTVPDITVEECTSIGKGDYIPPFTEEQCYTETACEDSLSISDTLKDREWEKNRDCRITNGVATPDDLAKGGK